MERITAAQLSTAVCVIILVHLCYRRRRRVEPPSCKALDPSLTRSSRPPLEVLYPGPADPKKVEVDIVAVHGLGSNVDWSWTWQDKKGPRPPVHWLKDTGMLPRAIPHARIIAYNYESRWHADAPKIRLELCGEELVRSLHSFRTDARERPIIFVAHSLGGLVVLYGLLYADRTELLKYLPVSTVGFAPLGTPFRGTKMQSLAEIVAQLMVPMGSHNGIIRDLEQDGKHLADKVHTFGQLRNRLDIPTTCFFELYVSDYGRKFGLDGLAQGRVVEEESAHIPGWERAQLDTDHFNLNKFEGPDDRSYQTVSNALHEMYANQKSVLEKRKQFGQRRHFMVPFGRNNDFVGRHSILEQLLKKVPPSDNKDDCQRTAIEGLGGIGKTQIALEAAYRVYDKHPSCSVFWVPAIDLTSFENAYREIGRLLRLPGIDDETTDVKGLVKTALGQKNAGSWLLIVDNIDDIELLSVHLADYLPFSRKGSILFTTRDHKTTAKLDIALQHILSVPEMNDIEATDLLRKGLRREQIGDSRSIPRLLNFLTNLPLAIKQASAFMASNTNVSLLEYIELCESSDAGLIEMLSEEFEDLHRYPDHAKEQNPVATTWLISFDTISRQDPQAADYLKFISFLAEKDIPQSLLPVASKLEMKKAIGTLKAYAFITEHDTPGVFDIHQLIRLITRNWLQKKGEWEKEVLSVVQHLTKIYPFPKHENRQIWMNYLSHGQAVLATNGATKLKEDTGLMFNVAESYAILGKYNEAKHLYRQIVRLREEVLGIKHPETLTSMNNLALVLGSQGKYEEAEKIHRQALELSEEVLGIKHPETLTSMNNLALVFGSQGKYEEAEKMHRQALELSEEVLGIKHPETVTSMNNLAGVLRSQGKHEEAEKIPGFSIDRNTR